MSLETAVGLAGNFNTQNHEAILAGELLLGKNLVIHQRRCHAQVFRFTRCPGITIRVHIALTVETSSVPHNLLWPDYIVEYVAIVEAVDVVLAVGKYTAVALVQFVPGTEQHLTL